MTGKQIPSAKVSSELSQSNALPQEFALMPNSKDWLSRSIPEKVAQGDKFTTALNNAAGLAASGLTAAQFTAFAGLRTDLLAAQTDRDNKKAAWLASEQTFKLRDTAYTNQFRALARHANNVASMTDALRAQAGLPLRDRRPSPGVLPTVQDLVALGRPSGANFLDWSGPTGGSLVYEIFTLPAGSSEWQQVGASTGTDFLHRNAGAGVTRRYRVVPRRGDRQGEPSNEASVY